MPTDSVYMHLAIERAWEYQGLTYPNPAVGSVILDKHGTFISAGVHRQAGSAHAELDAIKRAYELLSQTTVSIDDPTQLHAYLLQHHNGIFDNCTIYVTLEPCSHVGRTPSCANLIQNLGFKRVVIGTLDPNPLAAGGADRLRVGGVEVCVGIEEKRAKELLYPFVRWSRDRFVFFKLAHTLNGVVDGGSISSEESRRLVHRLRDRCDLLVIGGNTVRIDRPTLDARLCDGRAPDVLIYSRHRDFDKTIPLFSVPDRKVYIEDNFDKIHAYNFIMIEGIDSMMERTAEIVDRYMIFTALEYKSGQTIDTDMKFELLHQRQAIDMISWLKREG
jgi:diaminohydroxyphosphoribosylaminopyrimidine deaminase/5-amino-6-(5-phosphoribosylamino)uracil reductase